MRDKEKNNHQDKLEKKTDFPTVSLPGSSGQAGDNNSHNLYPFEYSKGDHVNGFEILEAIGQGGMGSVYKAYEASLKRVVAIKFLHPGIANDPSCAKRFKREAILAANLNHPNIVPIFQIEDSEKPRYFTMEFVQGMTLQEKIESDGFLKIDEVLRITLQSCDAVQYAHEHNTIHRDIKPSNIMLQNHIERVRITDFGIAQDVSGAFTKVTQPGQSAPGTPGFESPEQNLGQALDERTDIFSLGMTIYCMLTGRLAYQAENRQELAIAFREQKPYAPSHFNPEIPQTLDAIVMKMISIEKDHRYDKVADIAAALKSISINEERSISVVKSVSHKRRSNKYLKLTVSFLVLLLLVTGAWTIVSKYILPNGIEKPGSSPEETPIVQNDGVHDRNRNLPVVGQADPDATNNNSSFTLLAASVKDFSGTQGVNNWHYGYYDGSPPNPFSQSDFEVFPHYDDSTHESGMWFIGNDTFPPSFWTAMWDYGCHPNGGTGEPEEHWTVRRWISDTSGSITVAGSLAKLDTGGGDGVSGHIILDGNEVWLQSIAGTDGVGVFYELTLDVDEGSILDFAIAPRVDGGGDGSRFATFIYKGGQVSNPPALVAHYPFDQDTCDTSGHGFHGAVNGAVTLVQDPERGGVLSLAGDGGHVLVERIGDLLDGCTGLTVACWIKSNEISSDRGFVIFGDPPNANRGLRYDSSGSVNGGQNIIKCGIDSVFGGQSYESSSDVQTTDWQHVAMTWSSGDPVRLYIDGVEDTSGPAHINRDGFLIGYSKLIIGKGSQDQGWNGLIDDVRVYNYALSPQQVSHIPALVAHYPFDQDTLDTSGYGFHGTVNGAATLVQDPERGGVLSLAGDGSHVLVERIGDVLGGCTGLTVACWIKSNETSSDRGFVIFGDPLNGNRGLRYDSSGSANGGQNIIKCGISSVSGDQSYESSSDVQTTDWQHVAMTWSSGDQVRLYIDGVEDTSGPVDINRDGFLIRYSKLIIGKGSKDQGWNGLIDDVRVYNYALSPQQVDDLGQITISAPQGMIFVPIPGGTFQMGDSFNEGHTVERPVHTVTISEFRMSKYEVTNAQYAEYLNAANADGLIKISGGIVYASSDNSNSQPYFDTHSYDHHSQIDYLRGTFVVRMKARRDMSNHPVLVVSWYGAKAFCDYHEYRLPTEAEWEYAARGGQHDPYYRFPWGNTISHSQANYQNDGDYSYDVSPTRGFHPSWNDGIHPYTSPVGSFAANGYGLHDMVGNVWELTSSSYNGEDNIRIFRGGGWVGNYRSACTVTCWIARNLYHTSNSGGFRVCR